jgi:phosphatidylserine decarboxylase
MITAVLAAWREVRAIVLGLLGLTVLLWLKQRWLALISVGVLGWVIAFFRDPDRSPASTSPDAILAPADGRLMEIDWEEEPHFIGGPARRITIFLSLFDVHVQRSPYAGEVQYLHYQPGRFVPAYRHDAHLNEANMIGLKTAHGPMLIKQIAGILARRIVCWAEPGDQLATGQRLGLIRFGSRVDLLLPPQVDLEVEIGQQVYGGQTIVGRWQ